MEKWYSYNPGLLVWYRDTSVSDNNVGEHPGSGMLLPVDAHSAALLEPKNGTPWRSRVATMDATFGLERTISNTLTNYDKSKTYPSLNGESLFNDKKSYYSSKAPYNSVITPTYGLNVNVTGVSADKEVARLNIQWK